MIRYYVLKYTKKPNYYIGHSGPAYTIESARHFDTEEAALSLLEQPSHKACKQTFVPVAVRGHDNPKLDCMLRRDDSPPVYFIYSEATDRIKIGKSWNPGQRLKELQTGAASKLKMLAVSMEITEEELHERFALDREIGEWFRPSEDLINYIALLLAY